MTIKEIKKMEEDEQNKKLRLPKTLDGETRDKVMMAHEQFVFIIDRIIRNPQREDYLSGSIFAKTIMRKFGINDLKKLDNCVGSYEIKSDLGGGIFFDAHKLFPDQKYPEWIKPYYCFDNTRLYIFRTGLEASILSGIAFIGKPFLHSAILIGDNIIDFNYDLVISKDLYFTLTHFETLAELSCKQIFEHKKLIREMKGVQNYIFNFAFEEVMEREKVIQRLKDDGVEV